MKPVLIAAGSQYGNGKDVFCDYLVNKLNRLYGENTWHRDAFANNVKRVFCETFGVDREFVEKWKRTDEVPPGFQMPVRKCLTFIGDGFRSIREFIWIDLLLKNNTNNLCISDGRYFNEFKYVRENNGITVLIWRPGHENDFPNRSEQEVMQFVDVMRDKPDGIVKEDIPFDIWLKNDGTLEDFYQKIDKIVLPYVKNFLELRWIC